MDHRQIDNPHSFLLRIWLPKVPQEIGHTLAHYICTGEYQTLKHSNLVHAGTAVPEKEYIQSGWVYALAVKCELEGLQTHARVYMETFDRFVSLRRVLSLARKVIKPAFLGSEWYTDYLLRRIKRDFEEDEKLFLSKDFLKEFNKPGGTLNVFLATVITALYQQRTEILQKEKENILNSIEPIIKEEHYEE